MPGRPAVPVSLEGAARAAAPECCKGTARPVGARERSFTLHSAAPPDAVFRRRRLRFHPLISDYGFKATFGNEHNTVFLRRALQALIASEVPIEYVEFLPNGQLGLTPESRRGISRRMWGLTLRWCGRFSVSWPAPESRQPRLF